MLKKLFKSKARSFDKIDRMVTRGLPIPGLEGSKYRVDFTAKKNKEGYWSIQGITNLGTVTGGREIVNEAFRAALVKHTNRKSEELQGTLLMTFDTAFLILRDLEDSLLRYNNTSAGAEPKDHYMAAYRLMDERLKAHYDDLYFKKTREKGPILPAKTPDETSKPKGPDLN